MYATSLLSYLIVRISKKKKKKLNSYKNLFSLNVSLIQVSYWTSNSQVPELVSFYSAW